MKVVILAGGFGTRLAEYTDIKPKPMVEIGGHPMIWHIMNIYAHYGYHEFVVALGYKGDVIKDYFLNYHALDSDFTIDLANGKVRFHGGQSKNWKVTLVDTGDDSLTGGRVKRLAPYLKNEPFMLTYGDGVCDVNIQDLVEFHKTQESLVTVTAIHPPARYGELEIENNRVSLFREKPKLSHSWINGGFMVVEPQLLDLIENDQTILEKEPLEACAKQGKLSAFAHEGFWQCMDTLRDMKHLNHLWETAPPWKVW
ncbi:glucose-1-phosphate cytidylyltransferase [Deltaproteobacteria bacterium TL4]